MKKSISYFFLFLAFQLAGQDSLLVTKNFRFSDGIYMSVQELQADNPAVHWDDMELRYFTNPQTSLTQVESIILKETGQPIETDQIWALTIDGIPSLRVPRNEIHKDLPTFAALKLRGKICYFTYPDWRKKKIQVAAYNPLTGRPFRVGTVEREEEVFVEKIMRFETGEIVEFTVENVLHWIQDDPLLVETIKELPAEEMQEKLFKCLLIYADRNEIYVHKNNASDK